MIICYSKEIDERKNKFLKMSHEEYDKYMCEKYPVMFRERKLPMSQTCMCWSFDIGKGWYWILDNLCERLDFLFKQSKNRAIFTQIKEKFGGARFYHYTESMIKTCQRKLRKIDPVSNKHWQEIIDNEISRAEELCDYYCAECGESKHDMISVGSWVYDLCEKCLEKKRPEAVKIWKEYKDLEANIGDFLRSGSKEEIQKLKNLISFWKGEIDTNPTNEKEQTKKQKKQKKS